MSTITPETAKDFLIVQAKSQKYTVVPLPSDKAREWADLTTGDVFPVRCLTPRLARELAACLIRVADHLES